VDVRHGVVDLLLVRVAATGTNHVEACPKSKIKMHSSAAAHDRRRDDAARRNVLVDGEQAEVLSVVLAQEADDILLGFA
jgi:hypothetical protein